MDPMSGGCENLLLLLDDKSPTSTNLGNDHEFIIKKYLFIGIRHFGEAERKVNFKPDY